MHHHFAPLLIAAALAVIVAATRGVKSGRRYRGCHVRHGYGRHERPCRSDLVPRVLSALARVDVWILIMSALAVIVILVKPG